MHKFLRAIGFSEIRKRDLELITEDIIEHPQFMKITRDSEGNEFAEFQKEYGNGFGITVRGTFDSEEKFHMEYYYPYACGDEISTQEQIDIEKHAEKESYAGVCDEMRLGVTLIFYLQNVAEYLAQKKHHLDVDNIRGAILSSLSVSGKILLPIEQKEEREKELNHKHEKRSRLLAEAREGNEAAIESLTIEDMDTYSSLSKRITKEDVFSIVASTFMPYGIESDQYAVLGEILEFEVITNELTKEKIYSMNVECNDIIFRVLINQKDLLGEPAVGRRFKGNIWMQGTVCL